MINYMDAGLPPLSGFVASHMRGANVGAYCDPRSPAHLYITVFRLFDEVSIVVNFQSNPIARDSITRWVDALKSIIVRVAEGYEPVAPLRKLAEA
jgi:hypothetical protein